MLARTQCHPFVLAWRSLIYFLWGWNLILCSSKNPISKFERHPEVSIQGRDGILCRFLSLATYPCPSKHIDFCLILGVSVFLIDLEQEVSRGGTNILLIWRRTISHASRLGRLTTECSSRANSMQCDNNESNLLSTYSCQANVQV